MRDTPTLQRESGFTLLEMVFSVVLIGILAAVGSSMISDSFTTSRMVNAGNASEDEARYVLERLAREIREVKYISVGGVGSYCITTMTASQFVFNKRTDVNGTDTTSYDRLNCNTATNQVTINYGTPPNLTLGYATPAATATLTNRVASNGFALSYYQSDGTTVATTNATVYFVVITLTVTDATSQQTIAQRVRVSLRNS